ncbi:MAG: hypothetical protein Q9221_007780 [Calogaya cf. arnoldii]
MSYNRIFPVFCTVDVPSKVLTTFLLHAHELMLSGILGTSEIAILRSPELTSIIEPTPIPTSGVFPEDLISPFPNWNPQHVHSHLKLHARNTLVHDELFIILDTRSLEDYTCQVAAKTPVFADTIHDCIVKHEVQTLRELLFELR